ncbi:DHH family phosphoesterase [Mycoplasmopsis hyopharyngis]|uniref:DHH family phosphoesterase n=1 Tax=Mycoplasmopsis hyopharyngis TaxID=29558 RepID=UPI003873C6FE
MEKQQRVATLILIISSFLVLILGAIGIFLISKFNTFQIFQGIYLICLSLFSLAIISFSIYLLCKEYLYSQKSIKKSFNTYMEDVISNAYFGVIIFNSEQKILWCSKFVKDRFGRSWVGFDLNSFLKTINLEINNEIFNYTFEYKNSYYALDFSISKNYLSIKDISIEQETIKTYDRESIVLGELEIDNYQSLQSTLSEEQLFSVQKEVISILDSLIVKYNLVYRQYTNGKFIIITNSESLSHLEKEKFVYFKSLHDILGQNSTPISVSIGLAKGWNELNKKIDFAKKALLQSQNRGGDQVTIFTNNEPARYYGSSIEISSDKNRAKIKALASRFDKILRSDEINKVIIYGHQNADLDAIGAACGIYSIAKFYKKNAYICSITQDLTTSKAIERLLTDSDSYIIKPQNADKITDEKTLVVLVDNSLPERTDYPECVRNVSNNNVFVFDHHRQSKSLDFCNKTNTYIDPNASSASEIVTEIMMFLNNNYAIEPITAQMLLNGIYLDTLQFQKKVSSRTFMAAAWLEEKGAISSLASEVLKNDEQVFEKAFEILENVQEVKPGYFLAYKDILVSNDIISIASEEILRIAGRKASFVVAREEKSNSFKLSARGINTNVQLICEQVGGGGHFGAAAATSNEPLDVFVDNIIQAIVSDKNESNNN